MCPYSEPPEDGPAFSAEDSGESLRARSDARALHASKASSDEINASSVSGHVDEVLFASADDLVGSEGGTLLSDITLTMSRGFDLVNAPRARRGVRTRRASPSLRLHHREVGAGEEPARFLESLLLGGVRKVSLTKALHDLPELHRQEGPEAVQEPNFPLRAPGLRRLHCHPPPGEDLPCPPR